MPFRAFTMSVQAGWSSAPVSVVHIEPVRSRMSMMSSGFEPHGEQAVACAVTSNDGMPKRPPKYVWTLPVSLTVTEFAVVQPGTPARHFIDTAIWTLSTPNGVLLPPWPYWFAEAFAAARFGRE